MEHHIGRSLAVIGFGLLWGFFGLIWVANLFGVAEEHARQILRRRVHQGRTPWYGGEYNLTEPLENPGIKVGRYLAGGGFMLVGLAVVVAGVVSLFTG